jgi:peptidoglycan/LPS O-acetylase OafA/YrhL
MHVGKYSYGMYLIHLVLHSFVNKPLLAVLARMPGAVAGPLRVVYIPAMMFAVFLMARWWWKVIEEPFLRLKDRFRYESRTGRAAAVPEALTAAPFAGASPADS